MGLGNGKWQVNRHFKFKHILNAILRIFEKKSFPEKMFFFLILIKISIEVSIAVPELKSY